MSAGASARSTSAAARHGAARGMAQTLELIQRLGPSVSSIETNPSALTPELMERMKGAGVTRVSVGVQSLDDTLRQEMGLHKYGTAQQVSSRLEAGARHLRHAQCRLIFNLPHQSEDTLLRDIALLSATCRRKATLPADERAEHAAQDEPQMGGVDFEGEGRLYG